MVLVCLFLSSLFHSDAIAAGRSFYLFWKLFNKSFDFPNLSCSESNIEISDNLSERPPSHAHAADKTWRKADWSIASPLLSLSRWLKYNSKFNPLRKHCIQITEETQQLQNVWGFFSISFKCPRICSLNQCCQWRRRFEETYGKYFKTFSILFNYVWSIHSCYSVATSF